MNRDECSYCGTSVHDLNSICMSCVTKLQERTLQEEAAPDLLRVCKTLLNKFEHAARHLPQLRESLVHLILLAETRTVIDRAEGDEEERAMVITTTGEDRDFKEWALDNGFVEEESDE